MATSNQSTFSRRDFIVTLLSTGFALAVRPVSAQTIITDSNKLVTKEIKITVSDGEILLIWHTLKAAVAFQLYWSYKESLVYMSILRMSAAG